MLRVAWNRGDFFKHPVFNATPRNPALNRKKKKVIAATLGGRGNDQIAIDFGTTSATISSLRDNLYLVLGLKEYGARLDGIFRLNAMALKSGIEILVGIEAAKAFGSVDPIHRNMLLDIAAEGITPKAWVQMHSKGADLSYVHNRIQRHVRPKFGECAKNDLSLQTLVMCNAATAIYDVREAVSQGNGDYAPDPDTLEGKVLELLGSEEESGPWAKTKVILEPVAA